MLKLDGVRGRASVCVRGRTTSNNLTYLITAGIFKLRCDL